MHSGRLIPISTSRRRKVRIFRGFIRGAALLSIAVAASAQQRLRLIVHWDKISVISKSTATLQVVVNPRLELGDPLSIAAYQAVTQLGADYVRYVPWLPYPKLAVAELQPPTSTTTSWDFSLIDPMTNDFLAATAGHPVVMNFSTSPAWLYKANTPVTYPANKDEVDWSYTQGTELRDSSGKELGDYYARLVSWYVGGGFNDELGVRHVSGYHDKFSVWEVLNEVDAEHTMTPQQYTERYDAIVSAVHKVSPETKFMGLALAAPSSRPDFFEYFLNPANHKPGIPLDYISYHFYASPTRAQNPADWQYTFFDQADGFLNTVRYVETIRKRLSPTTKTDLDELGVILPTDNAAGDDVPPPPPYWNSAGSLFAYLYIQLSRMQIDLIGESQLIGYPTQYPSVSLMDWIKNKPNARFWVLKLLQDNFHPGDKLVETGLYGDGAGDVEAQAFVTPAGHKVLLANKRDHAVEVKLPEAPTAGVLTVDVLSGDEPPRYGKVQDGLTKLGPFAVSVVTW